jgi:signal transduction histidine kinase
MKSPTTLRRMSGRILALVLGPAMAALLVLALGWALQDKNNGDPSLSAVKAEVENFLAEAGRITELALSQSISHAVEAGRSGLPAENLEGLGIYLNEGEFFEWEGTPLAVAPEFRNPASTTWMIRRTGLHLRLVTISAEDPTGRRASATFLLDSSIEWIESAATESLNESTSIIHAPDGRPVARVRERFNATSINMGRLAGSAAAVIFAMLVWVLFPWSTLIRSGPGAALAFGALIAGRWAVLVSGAPMVLLPPSTGSPLLYGADGAAGLLASPADLFLTSLAIWLATRILVRTKLQILSTSVAFLLSAYFLHQAALSLATNSNIPILDLGSFPGSPARVTLIAALALGVAAAADSVVAMVRALKGLFTPSSESASHYAGAWRIIVAIALLAFAVADRLYSTQEQVGLDRLTGNYAPLITDQDSRRKVALRSALRHAADDPLATLAVNEAGESLATSASSRIWIEGDLFEGGYRSSLTIHDLDGVPVSHFGFGLPLLDENPALDDPGLLEDEVVQERIDQIGFTGFQSGNLFHAQTPLMVDGEQAGWVVAHVADEPHNLSFLPDSRFYLEALAPDRTASPGNRAYPDPDYVLYDSAGIVQFSTLVQPPAWRVEYDRAALQQTPVEIVEQGRRYHAYPLLERGRLHLLLLPRRSPLDLAGGAVRLALAALLALVLLRGIPFLGTAAGLGRIPDLIRRSFHRKLMATLLLVSIIPLIGLALFLMNSIQTRMDTALLDTATRYASVARRVVEDYGGTQLTMEPDGALTFDDDLLLWLKRVVGQDIHLFEDGLLAATSRRELFTSGLMVPRLPGRIYRQLLQENKPAQVLSASLGDRSLPVAYAPVRLADSSRKLVVAVPILYPQKEIRQAVDRVAELLLLTTVALVGLLAIAVTTTARKVARPVGEMVIATDRIAAGRYDTRLTPWTRDELADLVHGFNSMAASLESQRSSLTRRKDYIEALLQYATSGIVSIDQEGRIVTINPAARRLLELDDPDSFGGFEFLALISRNPRLSALAEALSRSSSTTPMEIDLEPGPEENNLRRLRLMQVVLPDPAGGSRGTLYLMDDVTDMMRSSQLEAWAEMARAIAHEIKNPLTPIQLSTEHLERILQDRGSLPSADLESCLDTIKKQVRNLREIARGFSTYAKLPALQPESADPVEFLRSTVQPYRASRPPGLEIIEEYAEAPQVSIDVRVMGRAIVNLIENALQSMSDHSGTLTARVSLDEPNHQVRFSIGDTGTGLSQEARKRLFEPYFSTKSSGTGLGLAIVMQSVQAHGGTVEVESVPGEGTVFHVLIPEEGSTV